MYDLYSMETIIKERQKSIRDEVRANRMAKKVKTGKITGHRQGDLAAAIGRALIAIGKALKPDRKFVNGEDVYISERKVRA